jgi:hypothetical protein
MMYGITVLTTEEMHRKRHSGPTKQGCNSVESLQTSKVHTLKQKKYAIIRPCCAFAVRRHRLSALKKACVPRFAVVSR